MLTVTELQVRTDWFKKILVLPFQFSAPISLQISFYLLFAGDIVALFSFSTQFIAQHPNPNIVDDFFRI